MTDILAEHRVWMAALSHRPPAWRAWIAQRLISFASDHYPKLVGVAKARIASARWEFAEDGAWSIVLPVYARDPALAADLASAENTLVDLVAWQPRQHLVGSRLGAGIALGAWNLAAAAEQDALTRLDVWGTPGAWLEHGGSGVFVLDWGGMSGPLRRVRCPIVAEDLETGERVLAARKRHRRPVAAVRVREGVSAR